MNETANIEMTAAAWVARQDGDDWTEACANELEAWLDADTAHRIAYLRLKAVWTRADRLSALRSPASAKPYRSGWRLAPWRSSRLMAASLAALIIAGLSIAFAPRLSQRSYATPVGGRLTVSLADHSTLVLNTDTRVRTEVTAGGGRLVRLDRGEAFFDVQHDSSHPFVVLAGDRRITDLGTRFSIWRNDDQLRVAVEEGKVLIEPVAPVVPIDFAPPKAGFSRPAVVTGGSVATADTNTLVVQNSEAALARDLSWRRGVLSFNQTTLGEAAAEFNRYNDKKLVVTGSAAELRIDGAFRSDSVDSFAGLLRVGFGLDVDDQGNEIRISHQGL